MWRECLTAQALQNLLSGGFPALIDDGSAHFRTSQPIRQDSWQSTWRDTGRKVEGPRGARWRDPRVQGGEQREHHETTRETQWGDFCKAVRELACCSALRRWATKNTRRESEAHAWEDAAVGHRRVAEVFGEVHASTRKRNVTLAAAGPDRWSW